ncbi:uncharacterized protein LOC107019652 [Solanum pennellii]|uniref:Uncharacterized protein LOC107019652 n=1 Tax=Solanum pennellii TaxID=28526 RepID=A0ABM1GT03_SOLPN|nr:uncharacterized protein LOC107019652 [Solanum pennellii]
MPTSEVKDGETTRIVPETRQQYSEADKKNTEKGYKAKKMLVCGTGAEENNRVSAFESGKEIWDCLRTSHEGTEQVKESKVDMLTSQYENFRMKEGETIHDMYTKLSSITNELRCLGEPISTSKQVSKVLRILPQSWESKVVAITEAKDLKVLRMDALIGNLKTYEMTRSQDLSKKEAKKDKSLVLKFTPGEVCSEEDDMDYLPKKFQKIIRKNRRFRKGGNPPRAATARGEKDKRRDLVPDKSARKAAAHYVVKKALAAWGDSSSKSGDSNCPKDESMLVIQDEANVFNGMFSLVAKLANVLIDSIIELTTERDSINNSLDGINEEKEVMVVQMSVLEKQMMVLEYEKLELMENLDLMIEKSERTQLRGAGPTGKKPRQETARNRGSALVHSVSNLKKTKFPHWAINTLITPLSAYWNSD